MKKILFILMLVSLMLYVPCFAQSNTYYPFPNSNAWWSEVHKDNVNIGTYYDYYVRGDTIVNGKTYFKLNHSGGYIDTGNIWQSYDSLVCLLREDTAAKRIYVSFKPHLGFNDTLLYDFNLKVGDTLPGSFNSNYNLNYVKSIDSVLIGTHYRKRFIIRDSAHLHFSTNDTIIEGIGASSGLLEPLGFVNENTFLLLCFRERDTTVYPYLNHSCQEFILGGPVIKPESTAINVYPNPSNGIFTITHSHPELVSGIQTIEVYNVLGKRAYNAMLKQVQHDYNIDLSSQPNGIYLYRVISDNGNLAGEGKLIIQK